MNSPTVHAVLTRSEAGEAVFPEVVRTLLENGVESYFVDFASRQKTLYTVVIAETLPSNLPGDLDIAPEFSKDGIVAAIRAAQRDAIRYPEFVHQATAAGVIGYWAFLTGRKVVYFGRKGAFHEELFPS
ncbi:hypothetical protein F183_A22800 [Bryobacterales bacterium F-183]|nr:hypothetical protein F183_A22800 [Bryobacterales bacterium F-183]